MIALVGQVCAQAVVISPSRMAVLVAFSRWRVERRFQDQKQEIGLDQWEGRHYRGLKRHLILSCVSYLFLARVREELRGEKTRAHRVPSPRRGRRARAELVA